MTATVVIRDRNGNTLAVVDVEGTPVSDPTLIRSQAGSVREFDNGDGWAVTLYREEDYG